MNNKTHIEGQAEEQEIHLRDCLEVMLRRKWVIISFFVVIVLTAGIATSMMTPIYKASTSLLIEGTKGGEAIFAELIGDMRGDMLRDSNIPSQVEIIKSRTIAEKVIRDIRYDQRVYGISRGLNLKISDMKIPDKFIDKPLLIKFSDDIGNFTVTRTKSDGLNLFGRLINLLDKVKTGAETREIGSGAIGAPFKSESGLSFEIKEASPHSGASFKIMRVKFNDAVRSLQGSLSVSPARGADVVNIKVQDSSPKMAVDVANSIANQYIQHDISQRRKASTHLIEFVDKQIEPTRKQLEKALEALASHRRESDFVVLEEGTTKLMQMIGDMERERTSLMLKERQVRSLYDEIQGDATEISTLTLSVVEDTTAHPMISRLTTLEGRKQLLLAVYTERHPQIIALTAEINELKRKISPTVLNILHSIGREKEDVSREIAKLRTKLEALPGEEKELAGLVLTRDIHFNIHTFLLEKLKEAEIVQASTISSIRVIDPAVAPDKPIKPNKTQNMLLAGIVGLMLSVGLAFFIDYLDNSIKSPRDVEGRLGMPIFGRIPIFPHKKPESVLVTLDSIKSVAAESYRSLRTNLQFAVLGKKEKRAKIFHLTSSETEEGKSTTIANLGIVLAQMGSKTLIIDMDLRKPTIYHKFGIKKEPGIVNLITGKAGFDEIVTPANIEHLYLIPAGITPPNPSDLLNQQNLSEFLDTIREEFDYILIDSPPVLPVADARLLGRLADATFLIIEMGATGFSTVEQSIKQLRTVGVSIAGVILNKVPLSSNYGYYQYYHKDD